MHLKVTVPASPTLPHHRARSWWRSCLMPPPPASRCMPRQWRATSGGAFTSPLSCHGARTRPSSSWWVGVGVGGEMLAAVDMVLLEGLIQGTCMP